MEYTRRFTEEFQFATGLLPTAARAPGTFDTAWLSMRDFHRAVAILRVGTIAAAGTVDFSIRQATDTAGAGAKAITGKAITVLTQAGGDGDDTCVIEVRTEELDVNNAFDCISGRLVLAVGTAYTDVLILRGVTRFAAVSTTALTEVVD